MKIEIGNRSSSHGCAMSWVAPSPNELEAVAHLAPRGDLERFLRRCGRSPRNAFGSEVFKKSSFQQFIRQAEIDVLGLRFDAGTAAVAVDSRSMRTASITAILETVGRILKKMILTFALEAYFDLHASGHHFRDAEDAQCRAEALRAAGRICSPFGGLRDLADGWSRDQRRLRRADYPAGSRPDGPSRGYSELFLRAQQLVRFCEVTPRRRQMSQTCFSSAGKRQ